MTQVKAITAKQAKKITERTGMCLSGELDGRTFYGTNIEETDVWEFDSKRERDAWVERNNK